jgi:hypothetical protein
MAEFDIIDPKRLETLQGLLNSGAVAIRPTGFGTIDENKNIENYDIVSFSIVNREPLPLVKP